MIVLLAALAQAVEPPRFTVQVDPLTTALGFVHLQAEFAVADHVSVYVGPHFRLFSAPWDEPEPFLGAGVEVGVRAYVLGTAPRGLWLLGRGVVAHAWATDSDQTSAAGYGSLLGGYTWIVQDRLVLSLGAGVQRIQYGVGEYGIRSWLPAAHTAVGVAF
ncbi:MAG: DUF3575 domain-containing protein [Proteobacteria bacterium]|nr:DUF3575 domain-containing protein [Pseudomonadota bacterium]